MVYSALTCPPPYGGYQKQGHVVGVSVTGLSLLCSAILGEKDSLKEVSFPISPRRVKFRPR